MRAGQQSLAELKSLAASSGGEATREGKLPAPHLTLIPDALINQALRGRESKRNRHKHRG